MDEYCKEKGFSGWFETSAKENINIEEAAKYLVNKVRIFCFKLILAIFTNYKLISELEAGYVLLAWQIQFINLIFLNIKIGLNICITVDCITNVGLIKKMLSLNKTMFNMFKIIF